MALELQPEKNIAEIVSFLRQTFKKTSKQKGVIAVSGGIDSALSLTLLTKALGARYVYPVFLPYAEQSTTDSKTIAEWNKIPEENWREVQIEPAVTALLKTVGAAHDPLRTGNIMARVRMIVLYDTARQLDGLVCGTENKSEKYLGYFTRFGDAASDIEPLEGIYKTQVRQLVEFLELPKVFLEKPPSAGLWQDQTDEVELGFSYTEADLVIDEYLQNQSSKSLPQLPGVPPATVQKVIDRVRSQAFKHQVPYIL